MSKFLGKVVIITGASRGLGAATAIAFAKQGAKLAIHGRNKERLAETAKSCKENGASDVTEITAEITDFGSLETIITKTAAKYGSIDILVNNASVGRLGKIGELELDDYEVMFNANVRAPIFLSKFALPYLKKTKGCVVNISGVSAFSPILIAPVLSVTKCALNHFTKAFAAECAPDGVRVNSINPGIMNTRPPVAPTKGQDVLAGASEAFLSGQAFGVIQPETMAESILFLCSASQITGTLMVVDGGATLVK